MAVLYLAVAVSLAVVAAVCRLLWLLSKVGAKSQKRRPGEKLNTLVVLGSGGHTSEMITLLSHMDSKNYYPITYVVADTDQHSVTKVKLLRNDAKTSRVVTIPRSREVHMSWGLTVLMTIKALITCIVKVPTLAPDLILVNGPGTCIPVILAAWFWKFFGLVQCRIVFVESFCRVKSLSMSGKIAYLLSDTFIVQWPMLLERYPRAKYVGKLC
mmetsp:Transcript_31749/g.44257  ORF Transcript_31749/g.44257 Transcript_31749/m.44257 type:complete len:213 (-) Transcript_31749:307-945(-)